MKSKSIFETVPTDYSGDDYAPDYSGDGSSSITTLKIDDPFEPNFENIPVKVARTDNFVRTAPSKSASPKNLSAMIKTLGSAYQKLMAENEDLIWQSLFGT